jgi:hypothetical protein
MKPEDAKYFKPMPDAERTEGSLHRDCSVARGVIIELNLLRAWIKDGSGYNRDDAPDEIARAIANRIREIEARENMKPLND